MTVSHTQLAERDRELDAAEAALDQARGREGVLVAVTGDAGLGKTALLEAIAARATGFRVLRARGAVLETSLAYGLVRRLLTRAVDDELLAEAPEAARRLLDPRAADAEDPPEAFLVLNALYWVCAALTERGPLLLAIDDAHWADDASLRLLAFLRERLDGLPIVIAVALRPTDGVLATIVDDPRTVLLTPRALSPEGSRALVLELAAVTDEQCDAAHAATGGVPFYLAALARELAAGRGATAPADIARLAPESVVRAVLARIRAAGEDAMAVAAATAVLGRDAELRHVAALSDLAPAKVAAAVDALTRAEILTGDRPLDFTHAIVRAAVERDLPGGRRALDHRRAADVLAAAGEPPLRVALQLIFTEPAGDPAVVEALFSAADDVGGPGSRETAAAMLTRALAEPPPPERRGAVLSALGTAERHLLRPAAREHLEAALAATTDPAARIPLTLELAAIDEIKGRLPEAVMALESVLDELDAAGADPAVRATIAGNAVIGCLLALRPVPARAMDDLAQRLGELAPGSIVHRMTAGVLASARTFTGSGTAAEVGALVELALRPSMPRELLERPAALTALPPATMAGRHDLVLECIDVPTAARLTGSQWTTSAVATWHALAAHAAGRLAEAEADAQAAVDGYGDEVPVGRAAALAIYAEVLLDRTGPEAAADALARLGDGPVPPIIQGILTLRSISRVALARNDHVRARRAAQDMRERCLAGHVEAPGMLPWQRELARALHRGGDAGAAALAQEHLDGCRRFGAAYAVADALIVLAEVGDADAREARLDEAVALAADAGRPLVHAAALAALGAHRRRTGRSVEAREPLEAALAILDACGAGGLRGAVHDELEASGVRPPLPRDVARHRLTASELRTVRLAADGLTNREIAQALFVTKKTVETHLRAAFRKLDVTARGELAEALRNLE